MRLSPAGILAPALALAFACLASACAGPQSVPPGGGVGLPSAAPPPAALPAPAAGPVAVDGTYVGHRQLIAASGPGVLCGTTDDITITVTGRAFRYVLNQPEVAYLPTRTFDAAIDRDGFFAAASGAAYMRGQVGGGHMQGSLAGDACSYQFQADRTGP